MKVTPEGKVKVLDFGLAKAFAGDGTSNDPTQSPTLSIAATAQGVILGTAAYMSPEQARGQAVDKRTDIWAFGCVLYELLTGKQAFHGDTVTEILAAVLRGEPDWLALPAATPTSVRALFRHCLQKDKTLRMRDAGDASIEIQEALAAPSVGPTAIGPAATGWRRTILCGVKLLVAGRSLHGLRCLEFEGHRATARHALHHHIAARPTIGRSRDSEQWLGSGALSRRHSSGVCRQTGWHPTAVPAGDGLAGSEARSRHRGR